MLTIIPILALTTLAAVMLVAAWPLLCLPRLRPVFAGATGTSCIAAGASLIALVMSGLLPGMTPTAVAQDEATTKSEAAAPSSTEGSGASESAPSPEPRAPNPSSPDPVLEVPPTDEVIIPPGRPSWVEQDPQTDSSGTHTIPVSSGPFKRHIDALRGLDAELVDETDRYIADYLGSELAPAILSYDAATIRRELVKPEDIYEEKIISPTAGEMHQIHARIDIDPSFRDRLQQQWQKVRATSRLTQMGLFAGAGLLLIGSIFSYFRLDNATRGYYTGRLQFLTAAAILAVIGGSVFAARWIHWL
ncbi:MAG TPA: hypothetical protein VFV87_15520 [Pirellulaceae bacterium]|nr:hypothetical protein [Pirellulaceae bacterium]